MGSVPVNVVVSQLMMYSNVIVSITISRDSFLFSQSCVKLSASLINVGSLAIKAFDLVLYTVPCLLLHSSLSLTLVSLYVT